MKVVYYVLIIVEKVKGFPRRVIIFLIHVILKKSEGVSAIKLEIQDAVYIL